MMRLSQLHPCIEEEEDAEEQAQIEQYAVKAPVIIEEMDGYGGEPLETLKTAEVEMSDSESGCDDNKGLCGVGRKRTIRLLIQSRAFL